MPKIVITEQDLTTPGNATDITDVVYIPGFVDVRKNFRGHAEKALQRHKPHLFTSINEFETLCGSQGGTFAVDQMYSDLVTVVNGERTGFDSNAVPYHGVMFTKGTVDPSYVMAKELIAAGLPVLYERVNEDEELEKVTSISIKDNFKTDYANYKKKIIVLKKITNPIYADFVLKANTAKGVEYDPTIAYLYQSASITEKGRKYVKGKVPDSDLYEASGKKYFKKYTTDKITGKDKESYTNKLYFTLVKSPSVGNITQYGFVYAVADVPKDKESNCQYFKKVNGEFVFVATSKTSASKDPEWGASDVEWKGFVNAYGLPDFDKLGDPNDTSVTSLTIPEDWYENGYSKGYMVIDEYIDCQEGEEWNQGNTYVQVNSGIDVNVMYRELLNVYDSAEDGLMDVGNYSIKYLTSGGYPTYEYNKNAIVTQMMNVAVTRGDCVAIIDHTDNPYRDNNIDHSDSLYSTVLNDLTFQTRGEFATMFTPWATYNRVTSDKDNTTKKPVDYPTNIRMSGTYAYLQSLADSIKVNANWLAIAGASRGVVPKLTQDGMTTNIPNGAADRMQPRDDIAINPITDIKPYGYTIWGNRTLKNNAVEGNLTATSFLNVRNMVSDIKKQVYRTARHLTYEQNNDILWVNFKAEVSPLLERMLTGYGISGYKMVIDTEHPKFHEKATLCVKIIIFPVYPVEDFYVSIVLQDGEATVAES